MKAGEKEPGVPGEPEGGTLREVPVTSPARSSTAVFIPPGREVATQKRLMLVRASGSAIGSSGCCSAAN